MSALIQNFDTAEKAIEASAKSAGSALRENEVYLDSIQGKIDQFTNAVQTMWQTELDSDWVKDFVNLGTIIIKVIDKIGLLNSALVALAGYSMFKHKMGPLAFFKEIIGASTKGISQVTNYVKGLKNIGQTTNELSKATVTLTQAQLKKKLTDTGLTDSVAEQIVAQTNLGKATDELSAKTLDATLREAGYSKEKRNAIVQSVFDTQATKENTQANKENAQSNMVAGTAEDKETQDTKENIQATKADTLATKENTQANKENAQSNVQLGQRLKSVGTGIKGFVKDNLSTFIALGTAILTTLLTKITDWLVKTMDEVQEDFDESVNKLNSINSELDNLESQLKDVKNQIDEINDNTPLSFADKEELSRLKAQSAELQRQIDLQEALKEQQQFDVNDKAMKAAHKYQNVGRLTGKTMGENVGDTTKVAGGIGIAATGAFAAGTAGSIIAAGGTIGATNFWNPVGWVALAATAITAIAALIATGVSAAEEKIGDSLDNMKEEYARLEENYNKARTKYQQNATKGNKKKFDKAQEAFLSYQANMANYMTEMDSFYNQIEGNWEAATEEQKKEVIDWNDTLDTWAIQTGAANAKTNAITRIFGENATNELKRVKQAFEDAEGAISLEEAFNGNTEAYQAFVQRLRDIGIYIYEVEDYFIKATEAENDFIDLPMEDVAKDISKITDGLSDLKEAFDEVIDKGYLTAQTLLSLKDSLSKMLQVSDISAIDDKNVLDAWRQYQDILMSGTATTEQMTVATENLVKAILDNALANNALTTETKWQYITQLQDLGVDNAQEYVEEMLQKNMANDITKSFVVDKDALKNDLKDAFIQNDVGPLSDEVLGEAFEEIYSGLSEEQIAQWADEYGIEADFIIPDEKIADIAKAYGVEEEAIQGVIDVLKKKKKIEADIAKAEDKEGEYNEFLYGKDGVKGYKALKEEYDDLGKIKEEGTFIATYGSEYYEYNGKKYYDLAAIDNAYNAYHTYVEKYSQYFDEQGNLKVDVPVEIKTEITNAEAELDAIEGELNNFSPEAQLKLNLQNKNELVDDIQNVFDTLVNAQKEYDENGHISVDTLQSLLKLEPKYLDLLVDEKGNLNLTKDALYSVAIARINDMKLKQQDAILTDAEKLANEGSVDAMNAFVNAAYDSTEAYEVLINNRLASIRAALEERKANGDLAESFDIDAYINSIKNQLDAVDYVAQSTINNIENSLSSGGNTASSEVEDAFQKAMDYWDNRISANEAKYDQIQNDIDWLESQGKMADANYYKDQIALITEGEESKTALLNNKLAQAAARMRELEAAGQEGSDEWWEAAGIYNDTLSELDDVRDTVIELQDAIGEVEWGQFEEFNTRLDDINSKLETMRDLIAPDGEEDWFDDEGNWTEKGVAVLGSYIQDLVTYKEGLNEANDVLDKFNEKSTYEGNEQWFADNYGIHSEQEYYDYLKKLTDEQYKYATAVSDTEQDIAGMYESSIDAVEEYTSELIDSYNDYIDVVKEALDAERDLYNFKKDVKKQTKDIANLERRIASLSGSTNASDIAERRKLEAELYESRETLNDTYYEHSMDSRQEALDQEAQAYEEAMNKFIENLRTNLDLALQDMDSFMAGVTAAVTANAPLILEVYKSLGISLDENIVSIWQEAADAIEGYTKEDGLGLMNSWTASGGIFDTFANNATTYLTSIWDEDNVDPSDAFANAVTSKVEDIKASIKSNVEEAKGYLNDLYNVADTSAKAPSSGGGNDGGRGGGGITYSKQVEDLQKIMNFFFGANIDEDGKFGSGTRTAVKNMQQKLGVLNNGVYNQQTYEALMKYLNKMNVGSWFRSKGVTIPSAMPQYAKGTLGTSHDEWALTDELGDELVLVPGANGNLSFMRKGTSVVPADITANLIEWGKLNPDMLKIGGGANINMISNAINKPEFNFDVENFLKVERVDKDTLPELERMMDKKIDNLVKQMNYALRGKGAR